MQCKIISFSLHKDDYIKVINDIEISKRRKRQKFLLLLRIWLLFNIPKLNNFVYFVFCVTTFRVKYCHSVPGKLGYIFLHKNLFHSISETGHSILFHFNSYITQNNKIPWNEFFVVKSELAILFKINVC